MMTLFGALMVIFGETIGSTGNEYANSPHTITGIIAAFSLLSLLISTAFFNNAALRDFKYGFNEILFTSPINKFGYYLHLFIFRL